MKPVDIIPLFNSQTGYVYTNRDPEWHAVRATGYGGSDVGTMAGLNAYKSPLTLWSEKSGLTVPEPAGEAAEFGTEFEDGVARMFARRYDMALVNYPATFRSKENPILLANVDRLIVEPTFECKAGAVTEWRRSFPPPGILGIWEGKTAGEGTAPKWADGGIPESYQLQVQYYLYILGLDIAEIGCAILGRQRLERRTVHADPRLQADLVSIVNKFHEMVEHGIQPEADGSESTITTLKSIQRPAGKKVVLDERFLSDWDEYNHWNEQEKLAGKNKMNAYGKILAAMGDAEMAVVDGEPIATYRGYEKTTLDTKSLLSDHPELEEAYRKTTYVRTLRKAGRKDVA